MASLYNRNGKIWISWYHNGKRQRKSTDLKDTKQNRKIVEKEFFPTLDEPSYVSKKVEYYYKVMMNLKSDCKNSTLERYDSIWQNQVSFFKNRYIDEITRSEIKQWLNGLDLSPKSVRMALSVLSQIYDEAVDDEAVAKNLCKDLRLPKLQPYEPQPFSNDEISTLLENSNGWFRNLLAILLQTGMRIGEALALEWNDVKDDYIVISKSIRNGETTETKTRNVRQVPIFNELRPFIKAQKLNSGLGSRVFPNTSGASCLRDTWLDVLKKSNMKHRVLYQTRHTFAINALDSGMFKVSQIAKMLGHNSTQMLFTKYAKFIKSETENIPKDFSTFRHNLGTKTG